jgi:cytochrome c-type biogenesis protein CcmI
VGLFLSLVTLPVSGPVGGVLWVAEQVRAAAEREYFDEGAIRQRLADLEQQVEAGELAEDEFEAASDELFQRLLEAREFWARQEAAEPVRAHALEATVVEEVPDA